MCAVKFGVQSIQSLSVGFTIAQPAMENQFLYKVDDTLGAVS